MTSQTCQNHGERGASATEYGVLVAFIGLAIVAGVSIFGESVDAWYDRMVAVLAAIF